MISRASSRRRTGSPKSFVVTVVPPLRDFVEKSTEGYREKSRGAVLHGGGRVVHGLLDVGVAGAPAEVAADHVVDLLLRQLGGVVPRLQTGGDRHQEARGAEAALQRVALAECLLHRVEDLPAAAVVA